MLIHDGRKFIQTPFDSEEELESIVFENFEDIFGPSSIYLPKSLLKTKDGFGTIPDGFVIDLSTRQWYVVEAELSRHSVWSHIAPQVAKQIIAASQKESRSTIVDNVISLVKGNSEVAKKFAEEEIQDVDIRKFLDEILETPPIVGMPIDAISEDLREWAQTLKADVKLWLVRKYSEYRNEENIIYEVPEEYRPSLDTEEQEKRTGITQYDVSILDLINADLLQEDGRLFMSYKPMDGERHEYEATIESDGSITVLGKTFSSPSYAALYGIQEAGSDRETVNGWTSWRTSGGELLADVRERYLNMND